MWVPSLRVNSPSVSACFLIAMKCFQTVFVCLCVLFIVCNCYSMLSIVPATPLLPEIIYTVFLEWRMLPFHPPIPLGILQKTSELIFSKFSLRSYSSLSFAPTPTQVKTKTQKKHILVQAPQWRCFPHCNKFYHCHYVFSTTQLCSNTYYVPTRCPGSSKSSNILV